MNASTQELKKDRTRVAGRLLRLLLGSVLLFDALEALRSASQSVLVGSFVVFIVLVAGYSLLHFLISRFAASLNRWIGAILALTPAMLVFVLINPYGAIAVVAYIGLSLVIDALRADPGCEVMAIPTLLFGKRAHLACILFSPIDWIEASFSGAFRHKNRKEKDRAG